MNRRHKIYVIAALILAMSALGCTGGSGGGGPEAQGFISCYNCHADGHLAKFANEQIFTKWLNGPHGNNEGSDGLDHSPMNDGQPSYAMFLDETCHECHDQLGDGLSIGSYYLSSGDDYLGRIDRPVIGCESCHGGGENHYGSGPLPHPDPDAGVCGDCHNGTYNSFHVQFHPERLSIFENYASSPHSASINEHNYVSGQNAVRGLCSRCHTDEGARLYTQLASGTESRDELTDALDNVDDIHDASPVQCRTCHNAHDPSTLLGDLNQGLPQNWSPEVRTCLTCHQLLKADGTLNTEGYHDPSVNPYGDAEEIIADTHYDDPATADIEGYVVNPEAEHSYQPGNTNNGSCLDCHNQHNADATINRQWARSGHAGFIGLVKSGDPAGAVTTDVAAPFTNYDFKDSSRSACQRCHTATGARNFLNNPAGYDPANNVYAASGQQRELIYCWACHTDNVGGVRNPGQLTVYYTDAPFTYPDIQASNVCLACHTGRERGESITNKVANFSNQSFINSHYLTAGGTVFTVTGYEYAGADYTNVSYYQHDMIGINNHNNTGNDGPCVGCHMSADERHLFQPVEMDSNDWITSITTNLCSNCHEGEHEMTPGELNEQRELFEASLAALEAQLASSGYVFLGGYPYFNNKNWLSPGDLDTSGNVTGKNNMGAAFNFNLLEHDPGAFVHNRYYAKRLIYDSIDWLDDNSLNGSVAATLNSGLHAGQPYQAGALAYLLSSSGGRP